MIHFLLKWSLFGRHVNFRGGRILFCWILAGFLLHRWNDEEKFEEGFLLGFVAGELFRPVFVLTKNRP